MLREGGGNMIPWVFWRWKQERVHLTVWAWDGNFYGPGFDGWWKGALEIRMGEQGELPYTELPKVPIHGGSEQKIMSRPFFKGEL